MNETPLGRIMRTEGRKQRWLADQVGVSESHMSYVIKGAQVSDDLAQAIAKALGRQVDEVFPPAAVVPA